MKEVKAIIQPFMSRRGTMRVTTPYRSRGSEALMSRSGGL